MWELSDWGAWGSWTWATAEELGGPSLPLSHLLPLRTQRLKGHSQAVGYQGESCGCKRFTFFPVFIVVQQQTCTVGAQTIFTGLVVQEVLNPTESCSPCRGAVPWVLPASSALLPPQLLPFCLGSCPVAEVRQSLLHPVVFAKPCASFPGAYEISCFVPLTCLCPIVICCLLAPAYLSAPFFPSFCLFFLAEENYPPQELEEMQRMK